MAPVLRIKKMVGQISGHKGSRAALADIGQLAAGDQIMACRGSVTLSYRRRNAIVPRTMALVESTEPRVVEGRRPPWDARGCVSRWLRGTAPRAVFVIETEIWPNLFRACAELRVPVAMASARVYPDDVARYAALRPFFERVLSFATLVGAQSVEEAARLRAIRRTHPPALAYGLWPVA